MPFKKLIKTVKDNHNKLKEKAEQEKQNDPKSKLVNVDDLTIHKSSKKGMGLKTDLFIDKAQNLKQEKVKTYKVEQDDTLKLISEKLFGNKNQWIMLHLKNIDKIPNPYKLLTGMILEIPYDNEVNNYYEIKSKNGNYIIQDKDDIKVISTKIFGSDKFAKRIIDWNFLKFTKDIYPGKEIKGLKFQDLKRQIKFISNKYNLKNNDNYHDFITNLIIEISVYKNIPAIVPLLVSDLDFHWFQIHENNTQSLDNNLWQPMNLDEKLYNHDFPRLAMDIEFNTIYGIDKLKELRIKHKNWPKAIVSYFMASPPGVGKPEEQKLKTMELIKIIDSILEKMNNKKLALQLKKKTEFQNKEHITFDLLYRELVDYKENSIKKYC